MQGKIINYFLNFKIPKMTQYAENENTSIPLGKEGLIAKISEGARSLNSETVFSIGDDAAVCDFSQSGKTVVSSDIFAEGIHFDLTYTPLKHLGYKVVIAGISDIYAMNAKPVQITVSLAVSNKVMQAHILEFYEGVHAACKEYNTDLIGGDLTTSKRGISIAVTAIGRAQEDELVYRSGAKPTDLICVTGDLGGAYMGLQLLEREKTIFNSNPEAQPELSGYDYILKRQLKPECPADLRDYFKKKDIKPTSMTDVSNGLASEILSLCNASKMGCEIFQERIPVAEDTAKMAKEFNIDPVIAALNGGEDYELLFTIKLSDYEKIKNNDMFSVIGSINALDKGRNIVMKDGSIITLEPSVNNQNFQNVQ